MTNGTKMLTGTAAICLTIVRSALLISMNQLNSQLDRVEETLRLMSVQTPENLTIPTRGSLTQTSDGDHPERQTTTPKPPTTPRPTATKVPTQTATPPPEMPAEENICGRNPRVQRQLAGKLKLASCRAVTTEQLYRLSGEYAA